MSDYLNELQELRKEWEQDLERTLIDIQRTKLKLTEQQSTNNKIKDYLKTQKDKNPLINIDLFNKQEEDFKDSIKELEDLSTKQRNTIRKIKISYANNSLSSSSQGGKTKKSKKGNKKSKKGNKIKKSNKKSKRN